MAAVKFLDAAKMEYFARLIHQCEPEVDDVIGFMDCLSLVSDCTSEVFEQNAMYNGYHSETMVNNIIAYGVFLAAINFPGSWHDGSITANILLYIHERIGNYKMCIDQGFLRSGDASFILVGPVADKHDILPQICDNTCLLFQMFMFCYAKPANGG
jgi:hypothetical protein